MTTRLSNQQNIDSEFIVFVTFSVWIMGIYINCQLKTHNMHQTFNFF